MKTKIILLVLILSITTSCSKFFGQGNKQLMIAHSFGYVKPADPDYGEYLNIVLATYQTNPISKIVFAGPYSDSNSDISQAESMYLSLKDFFADKTPDFDFCSVTGFQVYENVKNNYDLDDFSAIQITTEASSLSKVRIAAFIAFKSNDTQKEFIKEKVLYALTLPIDQREKVLMEISNQIDLWEEENKGIDIKINRTAFPSMTDEDRKNNKLENTFIELLAQLDEVRRKEFINQALVKLSPTGNAEEVRDLLIEKGCHDGLYE